MGTAINHPVPDRIKSSFVIFWCPGTDAQPWASELPGCQKLQMTSFTWSGTGCWPLGAKFA